ncbi:MAG: cytochrome c family protein [Deltaproteobacteria bacterium]|nr:cytochrome c family protein [Deltaproteobacteria bacterium]
MKTILWMVVGVVLLAYPLAVSAGPLNACTSCHDITDAKRKVMGPPLFGVYGAKPQTAGVPYAKWDDASLDAWLKNPKAVVPTTKKMFSVPNDAKRQEVIAALKELK